MNKTHTRTAASPANLIWIIEALCAMMQELGPEHHKFVVASLTGYGGVNKQPGRRGLLHVLLFKKQVCHELVTNFASHLDSKERATVSAALFDHAAFQAALNADIVSQLSGTAKKFFEFGRLAVFSSSMEASQEYALRNGESAVAWIQRHKYLFGAPDAPRPPVPVGVDAGLGPLTLLALPWLEGDVRHSLTADHEAVIQAHVDLAVAKSDIIRVLNGSEGESTPGTQFPLGPSFAEQLPPGSSAKSLPRQQGFVEARLRAVSISSSTTSSRPQSWHPTPP